MLTDVEAYRSHMAELIGKSHPGGEAGGPSARNQSSFEELMNSIRIIRGQPKICSNT